MDENLVGYLLNSLDPETHRQIEVYLRTHPDGQRRLDLLRRALEPLADDTEDGDPPPGLWVRTLAHIAREQCRPPAPPPRQRPGRAGSSFFRNLPSAPRPTAADRPGSSRSWWRRSDVLVAAGLLIVLLGVAVTLLPRWHRNAQIYACQNNLRLFHQALCAYSDHHDQEFPKVEARPPHNVAGIFVPILNDAGVLSPDATVNCPANGNRRALPCSLAELDELQQTNPDAKALARKLGGCYAYSLGYGAPDAHCGLRRDDSGYLPIMADRPAFDGAALAAGNSPNHGGQGQNVLYIDGHAAFHTTRTAGVNGDDIYVNQEGQVAAGCTRLDSVLGASWVRPYPPTDE